MPPIYIWENIDTGEKVEVLRSFSESDIPPTAEECKSIEGKWEKRIGNTSWMPGPGYGPRVKGNP